MAKGPRVQMSLQARFHAALALARMNVGQWAAEHDYSQGHVYEVLRGRRQSPPCTALMERFIAKHLGKQVAA